LSSTSAGPRSRCSRPATASRARFPPARG
jgi:hypothetical protein